MTTKTTSLTLAALTLSLAAANAMAQDNMAKEAQPVSAAPAAQATVAPPAPPAPPAPEPGSFEDLDKNADGALSSDEIPVDHALAKKFKKADADKSGGLNKEEFDTANQKDLMKK